MAIRIQRSVSKLLRLQKTTTSFLLAPECNPTWVLPTVSVKTLWKQRAIPFSSREDRVAVATIPSAPRLLHGAHEGGCTDRWMSRVKPKVRPTRPMNVVITLEQGNTKILLPQCRTTCPTYFAHHYLQNKLPKYFFC